MSDHREYHLYPFTCPFVLYSYSFERIPDNPSSLATSHVRIATTRTVVSQVQASPIVSGGHIPFSGSSYGPSHGIPHIPTYGASHGISRGTSYGTSHAPYYGPQYG